MARARSADRQQYWREVIERQQASGQSIVGFCFKEGLAPASFHAWKRRLRRSRREAGRESANQALVPVQIVSDPKAADVGRLEVQWPGGVVLRVQGCDAQTIGVVVAALSAAPATRRTRPC
ncbi:MAG: IS66 family insertion sequence element accessory protein TnpA [Thermoguttaceae bacterium]